MIELISKVISYLVGTFLENPVGQVLGFIAYGISVYTFAFCKNRRFIVFMAVLSAFWSAHFFLIGAMSAFIVNFIDVFKAGFALKYEKNKGIACVFLLLYIISGYFFYEGLISLFPIIIAIFGLYLTFFVRGLWLNLGYLISIIFWFIYNVYNGSIGGVASDLTLFVSGAYGIITMFLLKKASNTEKEADK